jgi:hypothetical protein
VRGTCKRCGFVGPVSPNRVCRTCVERSLAENPLAAVAAERAACVLDRVHPSLGQSLRTMAAVHVLLAFLARCRPRADRHKVTRSHVTK